MTAPTASGQVDISVAADVLYTMITDLDTMAGVADEATAMRWRKGTSAAPGAVFTGANRNGFRRWSTKCVVAEATPGTRFSFDVTFPPGIPVARWQYDIEALPDGGCRVTESTWDHRPAWFRGPAGLATGSPDRTAANNTHIANTLRRLKQRAESAPVQRG